MGETVGVVFAWTVRKLQHPILAIKILGQLDLTIDFDEIAHLRHEYYAEIEIPLLFSGDQRKHVRHIIIGLFELVESRVYAVSNRKRIELEGVCEDIEDGDDFVPTLMIDILLYEMWHILEYE